MSSKRDQIRKANAQRKQPQQPRQMDPAVLGDMVYGSIGKVDEGRQVANPVNIFKILPDPRQPRRTVPAAVRPAWDGQPHSLPQVFDTWLQQIEDERGRPFDIELRVQLSADVPDQKHDPGPVESGMLNLVNLAASIKQEGLTNPITVTREGPNHRIETGERRWLAYHLLHYVLGGDDWERIPARIVPEKNVWRQASENNSRTDLNAVSRARQYAILMIDLYETMEGKVFESFESFDTDQGYYAQAADLRAPHGKNELLLNAMGISNRSAFSRYKAILSGPHFLWQAGDDHNIPINDLVKMCKMEPESAEGALHQLLHGATSPAPEPEPSKDTEPVEDGPGTRAHFNKMVRYVKRAGHGKETPNIVALKYLRELREWIDDQEQRIETYLD